MVSGIRVIGGTPKIDGEPAEWGFRFPMQSDRSVSCGPRRGGNRSTAPGPVLGGAKSAPAIGLSLWGSHSYCRRHLSRNGPHVTAFCKCVNSLLFTFKTWRPSANQWRGNERQLPMCAVTRRRLSSGCKPRPATAPAGSNRGRHEGDEMSEAPG